MECRRCRGQGKFVVKTGKPGHDTHAPYEGVWCLHDYDPCSVCYGSGVERDKPPVPPYDGPIKIHSR